MQRFFLSIVTIVFLGFTPVARGQSNEELLTENQRLRARIEALESAMPSKVADRAHEGEEHKHEHNHDGHNHAEEGDHAHDGEWRFEDPFYPGWWLPSDEYRPYSWMPPPNQGFFHDLFCGQFVETHRSSSGTPWVHPFTMEPPQQHRDAFFLYRYTNDADGGALDEHEAEFHLDWALTRRFGILLGVPYLGLRSAADEATGFGDLELAPRITFVESDTFFLSSNILVTVPTGDETRGLGAGETTIAPFVTTWHDLGSWAPWTNWNTLFLNFGPQCALESGDKSLLYTVVFAHTILAPKILFPHHHGNGHGNGHGSSNHEQGDREERGGTVSAFGPMYPVGTTSFNVEFNGQTELQGDELSLFQLLTGFSYVLTDSAELRFGVDFPLNQRDQQMDRQYIFAFSHIF